MRVCKQCGQELDESCFRKTKSRSTGRYQTNTGYSTLCKGCESLNQRAYAALKSGNLEAQEKLRAHYQRQWDELGLPPVTAAARRLLGLEDPADRPESNKVLVDADLRIHAAKVRDRTYSTVEEADAVHRQLTDRLQAAGLYEETTNLLDDWYMDE